MQSIQPTGNTDTAEDVTLWAVNTGSLYKRHCEMARQRLSVLAWQRHARDIVLPHYRKELRTVCHADAVFVGKVAMDLRAYYLQHILEG